MEYEVACVDVTPLGDERKSSIATIGLWTDISVRVLTLPSLETIYTEPIPGGRYSHNQHVTFIRLILGDRKRGRG